MNKEFKMTTMDTNGNQKSLVEFIKPTKIKILSHTKEGEDDDQWLRLSSGKIKRIVGSEKGKAIVQSHMTYEDFQSRE